MYRNCKHLVWSAAPLVAALLASAAPASGVQSPYHGTPFQLPTLIQAENYDLGLEGESYHDTTPGNVFGVYRGDSMDVGAIFDAGGGYHIGYLADGEWAEYTVNVPYTQQYEIRLRVASAYAGPNNFHLELNGANVTGTQSVVATGDWHAYVIKTIPNVTLTAGNNKVLRIAFDTGAFNLDWIEVRGNTPFSGAPVSLPASRLQAESYDRGGEGVAWHDTTAGNVFGVYRTDDMDVGNILDGGGGYHLGNIADGEWAEYLVNVTSGGTYDLNLRYASAYPYATSFRVLLDGAVVSGPHAVTSTGGWNTYAIKKVPITVTAGSNKVLRLAFDVGAWNLDWLELTTPSCSPPVITQHPASQTPTADSTFMLAGAASGSPAPNYQWLKDGVAIAGATSASLSRTAVIGNSGQYQLRATNSCGSMTSNPATVRIKDCGPGDLVTTLASALRGEFDECYWEGTAKQSFPDSLGDGSYNKEVIAAAIALVREPVRSGVWNMETWWPKYLQGELGLRGTEWYYGGKELTSYIYQHYNISAVMAVHFHAQRTGRASIRDLSRSWLRATWFLHALSGVDTYPLTFHDRTYVDPAPSNFKGPYLTLPGMRSASGFWHGTERRVLFSEAVAWGAAIAGEPQYQKDVRTWVDSFRWPDTTYSVYGLTVGEEGELRNLVVNGTLPSGYQTRFLGSVRTIVPLHFLRWSTGVRATLMEGSRNNNTTPTYGAAYFPTVKAANGREVHFLYPWSRLRDRDHRHCVTHGSAALDLPGRRMTATNGPPKTANTSGDICTFSDGTVRHPEITVVIDGLPLGAPMWQITLRP